MEIVEISKVVNEMRHNVSMKTVFDDSVVEGGRTLFGTVSIPPGSRVPLEGTGTHDRDEYSIIIKGSILIMSNGKTRRVSTRRGNFYSIGGSLVI